MLWKFRLNDRADYDQLNQFIEEMGDAWDYQTYPPEVRDMVEEYDRSSTGRVVTSDKTKADTFLVWLSTLPSWWPRPHPMKYRATT